MSLRSVRDKLTGTLSLTESPDNIGLKYFFISSPITVKVDALYRWEKATFQNHSFMKEDWSGDRERRSCLAYK